MSEVPPMRARFVGTGRVRGGDKEGVVRRKGRGTIHQGTEIKERGRFEGTEWAGFGRGGFRVDDGRERKGRIKTKG